MFKCGICEQTFISAEERDSHDASHAVRPVREKPLSYLLVLPDGVTVGRFQAAVAFANAFEELRQMHPARDFTFFPFSYKTVEGEDPALDSILAIAE